MRIYLWALVIMRKFTFNIINISIEIRSKITISKFPRVIWSCITIRSSSVSSIIINTITHLSWRKIGLISERSSASRIAICSGSVNISKGHLIRLIKIIKFITSRITVTSCSIYICLRYMFWLIHKIIFILEFFIKFFKKLFSFIQLALFVEILVSLFIKFWRVMFLKFRLIKSFVKFAFYIGLVILFFSVFHFKKITLFHKC